MITDWNKYFGAGTYFVQKINFYLGDDYDEDKLCIKMMAVHNIDNVRGGSFCQQKFHHGRQKLIKLMIQSATNHCFICDTLGHFATDCPSSKNKDQYPTLYSSHR